MLRRPAWFVGAVLFAALGAAPGAAQTVRELGPAPINAGASFSGRVSAIAVSPSDPGRFFITGADGGVWRTTDGGSTWKPLTDDAPTTAMGALAIDPTDERIIYAGSGEANFANHSRYGLGIFKSVDGGDTWKQLAADVFAGRCISRIVIDPSDPDVVYGGVTRAGGFPEMAAAKGHPGRMGPLGVFKSVDAGVHWTRLTGGLPDQAATDLAMSPTDPQTLYAAIGRIFGAPENGIYKSVNGGATWSKLAGGFPQSNVGRIALAVAPSNAQRLYAIAVNPSDAFGGGASTKGTYRSDDGGQTWSPLSLNNFQSSYGWYLCVVRVHPTNPDLAVFGGLPLYRTVNGGQSFADITPPHPDHHAIAWSASGDLIIGNDGGIWRSANQGNAYISLNKGFGAVQFYPGLATHPTDPDIVLGGAQDNGTNLRSTDSLEWMHVFGGDGGCTAIDQVNPLRMFAEYQGTANLFRSDDGGQSFYGSANGIDGGDRNCFLPPFLIDSHDHNRMLYGTHRVYRSVNGGATWAPISADLTKGGGAIRALAISPADSNRVWAATNDGNVLVSSNGGQDFGVVVANNPGWPRLTRELCPDVAEPDTLYRAVAGFGTGQVMRTLDAGKSWEALDGNLPDVPVNVVALDGSTFPASPYIGTDAGVYRSLDDGKTWKKFGDGMPNACVTDLIFDPARKFVTVGTQGRGAWRIFLDCPADCDGSGGLDAFDFLCYTNLFNAQDAKADLDGDGEFTLFDFLAYQNLFVQGCA
jgi:photosystem II stability/assembly factor-like uncharacterized protein